VTASAAAVVGYLLVSDSIVVQMWYDCFPVGNAVGGLTVKKENVKGDKICN
jgi:hypothetical protein